MTKTKKHLLLFGIVVLAFFLRFYNIENTPPGVYPDEAVNGIDAMRALTTGDFRWFYPDNQGREGFFMNMIAIFFWLFGTSITTLKLPAIFCGTLTVMGTYLLTKELFNKERTAFISSFLVAVSFWAINFSRISFRANMLPAILVFSFYFLWKGLRTKKWYDFAIGGFIFGIGMHSYIAFRIAPAILLVTLVSFVLSRPGFLKQYWKAIVIFTLFSIISAAPMFYTFYTHPEYLSSRTGNVSVLSPEVNHGKPLATLSRSLGLSLVKYNFWGDQNWRHNYPPYPILDPMTGIAFLFGIIYSFLKFFRFAYLRLAKRIASPNMDVHVFLLSWFFIMLAPEFMTAEGLPHALRAIGNLPVTFIFAGLTFEYFLGKAEKHSPIYKSLVWFLTLLILFTLGLFNGIKYHVFWASKVDTARSFEKVLIDVSKYVKTVPQEEEIYFLTGSMQRIPVRLFNWERANITYLYPNEYTQVRPKNAEQLVIILAERNDEIISKLQSIYTNLQLEEKKDELGISFYILK